MYSSSQGLHCRRQRSKKSASSPLQGHSVRRGQRVTQPYPDEFGRQMLLSEEHPVPYIQKVVERRLAASRGARLRPAFVVNCCGMPAEAQTNSGSGRSHAVVDVLPVHEVFLVEPADGVPDLSTSQHARTRQPRKFVHKGISGMSTSHLPRQQVNHRARKADRSIRARMCRRNDRAAVLRELSDHDGDVRSCDLNIRVGKTEAVEAPCQGGIHTHVGPSREASILVQRDEQPALLFGEFHHPTPFPLIGEVVDNNQLQIRRHTPQGHKITVEKSADEPKLTTTAAAVRSMSTQGIGRLDEAGARRDRRTSANRPGPIGHADGRPECVVTVPTFRRRSELQRLLDSLVDSIEHARHLCRAITVLVVDNDERTK